VQCRDVEVTEAGSYSRPIDSSITQLKAQGPVARVKKCAGVARSAPERGWGESGRCGENNSLDLQ
jgi:hypothetical protein